MKYKENEYDDSPGCAFSHSDLFGPIKLRDGTIVAIEIHSKKIPDGKELQIRFNNYTDFMQLTIGNESQPIQKLSSTEIKNAISPEKVRPVKNW